MTKAIAQTYDIARENRAKISFALMAVCAFMICAYAFNLYKVISNTVALQKVDRASTALAKSVDQLDSKYLDLSSRVTPDNLASFGLKQGEVTSYISKTASLGSVAVRGNEL